MDGDTLVGLIGLLILALVIGVAWKGIFKIYSIIIYEHEEIFFLYNRKMIKLSNKFNSI